MTTKQTLQTLRKAGKPISLQRLYTLLDELDIKPVGARQSPQQYPDDTADRILKHYGMEAVE